MALAAIDLDDMATERELRPEIGKRLSTEFGDQRGRRTKLAEREPDPAHRTDGARRVSLCRFSGERGSRR